jgi:hypothetical protein
MPQQQILVSSQNGHILQDTRDISWYMTYQNTECQFHKQDRNGRLGVRVQIIHYKPSARVDAGIPSTQEWKLEFPQLQFHKALHKSLIMLLCMVMYV